MNDKVIDDTTTKDELIDSKIVVNILVYVEINMLKLM